MLKIDLNGRFADVMEIALYNTVLTSMSSDGKRFTYENQLASSEGHPSVREEWFTCACCPPNVLRTLGLIGGYIYTQQTSAERKSADVAVHLYISSTLKFDVGDESVELTQESNWPWEGGIKFKLSASSANVNLKLRVPGWAPSFKVRIIASSFQSYY